MGGGGLKVLEEGLLRVYYKGDMVGTEQLPYLHTALEPYSLNLKRGMFSFPDSPSSGLK